ncbi:MAG: carboxypeptidase regulatory-like domain-containing protein [bacterium]|nr:carboxypeptidase regulatory-like domain-containing protein [bacterium]
MASEKVQEIVGVQTETPSLAPIIKSSPSVRRVLQVDCKRGALNLVGALSWIPTAARLNLTFDLHCLGEGGNQRSISRESGRFQRPERILHTTRLTGARLGDFDAYEIEVYDLVPQEGGKYFLQVRGLDYDVKSKPFIVLSSTKTSVQMGVDSFIPVLPAGGPRAWIEGELSTLTKIFAHEFPLRADDTIIPGAEIDMRHRQLTIGLCKPGGDSLLARGSIERTEDITRFYASSIHAGDLHLVVMAEHLPPISFPVSIELEKNLTLDSPVQFPPSARLSGRIHGFGGGQLTLMAERITKEPGNRLHMNNRACIWDEGQLVSLEARATTDDQGRFAFKGLSQGSYRITLDEENVEVLGGISVPLTIDRICKTGASNIDFLFPAARIRISSLSRTEPATPGSFVVYTIRYGDVAPDTAIGERSFTLFGGRPLVLFVEPNSPLSILVPGEENQPIEIWSGHSGPAGSETDALLIHNETAKSDQWIRSGTPGLIWVRK